MHQLSGELSEALDPAGQPLRRIVAQLRARKIAAPRGEWSPSQVSRSWPASVSPTSGDPMPPSDSRASHRSPLGRAITPRGSGEHPLLGPPVAGWHGPDGQAGGRVAPARQTADERAAQGRHREADARAIRTRCATRHEPAGRPRAPSSRCSRAMTRVWAGLPAAARWRAPTVRADAVPRRHWTIGIALVAGVWLARAGMAGP